MNTNNVTTAKMETALPIVKEWLSFTFNHRRSHLRNQWVRIDHLYQSFIGTINKTILLEPSKIQFSFIMNSIATLQSTSIENTVIYSTKKGPKHSKYYIFVDLNFSFYDVNKNKQMFLYHDRPIRVCSLASSFIKKYTAIDLTQRLSTIIDDNTPYKEATEATIYHARQTSETTESQTTPSSPGIETIIGLIGPTSTQLNQDVPKPTKSIIVSTPINKTQPLIPPPTINTPSFTPRALEYIQSSKNLNFELSPRPDFRPNITDTIPIRSKKRMSKATKWHMMATASALGFEDVTKKMRMMLAEAIGQREAYLGGYKKPPVAKSIIDWWNDYSIVKRSSFKIDRLFESRAGKGRIKKVTYLERQFPHLLHSLYRYATKTIGVDSHVKLIVNMMNSKAALDFPLCPIRSNLGLTKSHFWTFFNGNGGKLKSPVTKPRLSPFQGAKRLKFSKHNLKRVLNHEKKDGKKFWQCFLDEKWMYTTSRRKKLKILPPAPWEDADEVAVAHPKIRNRRFPCKVMYMGIVAPPELEYEFKGKIYLKRISKPRKQQKPSYNKRYTDSHLTNSLIEEGHWKTLIPEQDTDIIVSQLVDLMQDTYHFDNDIASRITFNYHTYPITKTQGGGQQKVTRIANTDAHLLKDRKIKITPHGEVRQLSVEDIFVRVHVKKNTIIQEDCSCDSRFMLSVVDEIGTSIRKSFHWVDRTEIIHLFMDNAGGHGTDECKDKYVAILNEKYNIKINW